MGVDVGRGGDVAVAQPLLDLLHGHALLQQQTGAGVAQIVKTDVPQAVVGQQLGEAVGHRIRQNQIAYLIHDIRVGRN